MPKFDTTVEWIDDKLYKKSPIRFAVPPPANLPKIYWGYVKKEVRMWYRKNLRDTIEVWLRKFKISYVVDMDPMAFSEIPNLNTKTDRQLIFMATGIMWVLEGIWDMISASIWPQKKEKPKSIIKKKPKKTSEKSEDTQPEKKDKCD